MTTLRKRMTDDMAVRWMATATQEASPSADHRYITPDSTVCLGTSRALRRTPPLGPIARVRLASDCPAPVHPCPTLTRRTHNPHRTTPAPAYNPHSLGRHSHAVQFNRVYPP